MIGQKNSIRGSIRFRLWDTEQHVCCTEESSISRYHFDVLKAKVYNYIKSEYSFYRKILHFSSITQTINKLQTTSQEQRIKLSHYYIKSLLISERISHFYSGNVSALRRCILITIECIQRPTFGQSYFYSGTITHTIGSPKRNVIQTLIDLNREIGRNNSFCRSIR